MRRWIWAALFVLMMLLSEACAETPISGRWQTLTGDTVTVVIQASGDVTVDFPDGPKTGVMATADGGWTLGLEDSTWTLEKSGDFLILRRDVGEAYVLVRDVYALADGRSDVSEAEFAGQWVSDFALVSGFQLPLTEESTLVLTIADGTVTFSMKALESPVTLPYETEDGKLCVNPGTEDALLTLEMLSDGTLIRRTHGIIYHFVKTEDNDG